MDTYTILMEAHSGWRMLLLLVLIVALVKYLIGWLGNGKWANFDTMLNRVTPIFIDIQWLLGLIVWITNSWWSLPDRARAWEHPIMGTLALVAAHVVAARTRKAAGDKAKFRTAFIGYLITGLLIALNIYLVVGGWNLFAL